MMRAIAVEELSLAYRVPYEPVSNAKELALSLIRRQMRWQTLWALQEVSFEIKVGEIVGVVGSNGAGKSSLLRVISRILEPTAGRVIVRGHLAPLIELGAGIDHELTGHENIILYGALLGRDPREMRRRATAIAEWAGLSEFLHVPVRTYSSGMMARLAFSISTDRRPDVLLVDEVLSVGDEDFRTRSIDRIRDQMARGTTVLIVSHSSRLIRELVTRVIWLDRGRVVADGPTELVDTYRAAQRSREILPGAAPER